MTDLVKALDREKDRIAAEVASGIEKLQADERADLASENQENALLIEKFLAMTAGPIEMTRLQLANLTKWMLGRMGGNPDENVNLLRDLASAGRDVASAWIRNNGFNVSNGERGKLHRLRKRVLEKMEEEEV